MFRDYFYKFKNFINLIIIALVINIDSIINSIKNVNFEISCHIKILIYYYFIKESLYFIQTSTYFRLILYFIIITKIYDFP